MGSHCHCHKNPIIPNVRATRVIDQNAPVEVLSQTSICSKCLQPLQLITVTPVKKAAGVVLFYKKQLLQFDQTYSSDL